MAIVLEEGKKIQVEAGDTLWSIAEDYLDDPQKYTQLAAINNIPNPNLIAVGSIINLPASDSSSTATTYSTSSKVVINQFGLQSNAENTLFATWTWNESNTENYQVMWYYDSGDNHWFVGNDSTTKYKESTYSIPSNAIRVLFRVKPISKTHTVNNQEVSYWTASWSTDKTFNVSAIPPKKPSAPNVEIDKFNLTAELDNIDDLNAKKIEFRIYKDNSSVFKTGTSDIKTSHASYSCTVDAGHEYKVRCRAIRDNLYSDWSEYSSNVGTVPSAPKSIIEIKALSETSVQIKWEKVSNATSCEIEYTTKKIYFGSSNEVSSITVESTEYAEITGLETGNEYFFRVRAINDQGNSSFSEIKSIIIGKAPAAPTTWSSTTTVITGEPLRLYWVHNSEDGSSQTYAELELTIDGETETITQPSEKVLIQSLLNNPLWSIPGMPSLIVGDVDTLAQGVDEDKTSVYFIDTSSYSEGAKIQWRVRTAGITKTYGDWSVQRTVDIYAPPTLELGVTDIDGNLVETLTSFPFYISGLAGPNTQAPIGYYVTITANSAYETVDQIGNKKTVSQGDPVYSKYFDTSDVLLIEMSASNVNLENNINYTVSCVVSMNSGLNAESSLDFTVAWTDMEYEPNAEISVDKESFVAHIRPYCEKNRIARYKVSKSTDGVYTKTTEELTSVWGEIVYSATTETGEQVYKGVTGEGEDVYYCESEERNVVEDILLSVYRREFDGSFTELATGLDNSKNTFITDPHPALDYARYRVVAISKTTGSVSYYDVPGYYVGGKAVIIQWNEEWTSFDTYTEDSLAEQPWAGSLLKLPYNIDVSDKHASDVSLVEYIGRKHPVSYYGTQLGETSSWNVEIPKDDIDTLYALRRLAIWMGDVYVREPSGSGYWANISVSFSQTHCELTIPVTLDIKRVEGGA